MMEQSARREIDVPAIKRVERTHKFRTTKFPDIGPSHTPRKAYLSRANILIRKKKIYAQQREKTTTTTTMRIRKSKTKERIARYNINVPRESQQSMIRQTYFYFKTKNNRSMMMCARMAKETLTQALFLYKKAKTLNYNNGSRAHSDEKGEKKDAKNGVERRKRRGKSAKKKK